MVEERGTKAYCIIKKEKNNNKQRRKKATGVGGFGENKGASCSGAVPKKKDPIEHRVVWSWIWQTNPGAGTSEAKQGSNWCRA